MSKTAFIFPGQGSQQVGMGKEFYDSFTVAKETFEEVDEALKQNLSKIIFEGSQEDLTLTENTQPALMVTSIAILRVLLNQSGKDITDFCNYVAGHSLGEYTALCAAGTFTLEETAKLLKIRGQAMQQAVPQGKGAMAAIIGLSFEDIKEIADNVSSSGEVCEIANDNSVGQIVISGSAQAIDLAEEKAKEKGAKRYVKLPVSAPFHCSLMKPAQERMAEALNETIFKDPRLPVIANVTAEKTSQTSEIKKHLIDQVTARVRWRETVINMASNYEVSNAVEIGEGKVLSGLVKKTEKSIATQNISKPAQMDECLEKLLAA